MSVLFALRRKYLPVAILPAAACSWLLLAALAFFTAVGQAAPLSDNFWIDLANDRVDKVRDELALGADPNAVNSKGQPALMQAIRDGAWKSFDLLLAHRNIDVNAPNQTDETPLMYIAIVGDIPRARALIKKGAQVNRLGWAPLHYAASKGQIDMVRFLIANDAIVNAPTSDGTSPLMMAAYDGSEGTVRALLEAGADVAAANRRGEDAALWARRKDHEALAAKLDALSGQVLAARENAAGRNAAQTMPATPQALGAGGFGAAASAGSTAQGDAAAGKAQPPAAAAQTDDDTSSEGSTSRYFDLDRFDREDEPF